LREKRLLGLRSRGWLPSQFCAGFLFPSQNCMDLHGGLYFPYLRESCCPFFYPNAPPRFLPLVLPLMIYSMVVEVVASRIKVGKAPGGFTPGFPHFLHFHTPPPPPFAPGSRPVASPFFLSQFSNTFLCDEAPNPGTPPCVPFCPGLVSPLCSRSSLTFHSFQRDVSQIFFCESFVFISVFCRLEHLCLLFDAGV